MAEVKAKIESGVALNSDHLVDGKYSIRDLVDLDRLSRIFEEFSQATGFTTGFVSYPNQEVLIGTGWRDICTKFHRACPESVRHCKESNLSLTKQLKNLQELSIRHCGLGLVDGATPVIIKGKHIASIFTGQVLFEQPDVERFKQQAETFGFDVDQYLRALAEVPVVPEERLKTILSFLSNIASLVAEQGLNNLRLREDTEALESTLSERKRAEEKLRFRAILLDSISDLVTATDLEGRITYVNHAVCDSIGRSREQLIGEFVEVYGDDPGEGATQREIVETTRKQGEWHGEIVNFTSAGERMVVECRTWLLRDDQNNPIGMCGVSRDITERKRAEEALRESEARVQSIFRAAPIGIGLVSNRILKHVNERVCKMTGYTRDELVEHSARVLYPTDEDYELVGQEEYHQIAERGTRTIETRWQRADGTVIDILLSSTALDPENLAAGVTFTALDITERKRAEGALRKSEALLKQMADTIEDVFWITNWEDHRTIFASLAYEQVWGRTRQQLYANPSDWTNAIHPEDRKRTWEAFLGLEHDRVYDEEYRIVRPDGTLLWVRDRGYPVRSEAGQVDRVVGIAQDITERKRAEAELAKHRNHLEELVEQRTQELEESREKLRQAEKLASVGTFAAGVAHEINNPVGAMVLAAEYALRVHDRPDGMQEVLKSLSDIIRDGRRSREIVQNVLRFSRQEPTEKCPCNLNEVVNRGLEVALLAHPGYQGLKFGLADDLPTVLMNSTRMEQVVANLVKNAIESRAAHGTVSVRTERAPDGVRIVVTDDGRGMTEQQRRQAFDPFFTTRQHQGGTGLGLSITHGIVSEHGGTVNIASVKGRGTVVTVELPT